MRRILLGGLGIVFGAFAQPVLAQQPNPLPQNRAAAFGRPSAVTALGAPSSADTQVTPAGLFRNGQAQPTVTYSPPTQSGPSYGTPAPIAQLPGTIGGTPVALPGTDVQPMVPPTMPGAPIPLPVGPPTVTETHDPTGRIPTGSIPSGSVIPSVMPEGFLCPEPCPDNPLFCQDKPGGLDRFRGIGCGRNWVSAETLLWWTRGTHVPPLVTTSSPQFNGIPGQGDTRVLLGGSFGDTFHVGGRIGAGHWFDDCARFGVDAHLFWVAPSTETFNASVPPLQFLARPFFNVNPNTPGVGFGPSAEVIAGPGVANGNVVAALKSTVWGADINYRQYLLGTPCARLDMLVGYRYLDVSESLTVTESFNRVPGSNLAIGVPAQMGLITDQFKTNNQFHGGQIGLAGTIERGRWSLDARSTIAFGTVFQNAQITGGQVLVFPNGSIQTMPGGLLAVPGANIGRFSQSKFAVVPEFTLNVGYQVTPHLKLFVGYNFLGLSNALRPGGVIDTNIDAARVPNLLPAGAAPLAQVHPVPLLHTSDYFVQGINFGLVYRW
jgi:hypothetical protein